MKKPDKLRDIVFENLVSATEKQKDRYNQGRKKVQYFVGDRVLLKTHTLSDATKGINAKLSPLYEGPYTIKETKAENIYVLDMGASKRLDEAHVSELRKYREPRRRLKPK